MIGGWRQRKTVGKSLMVIFSTVLRPQQRNHMKEIVQIRNRMWRELKNFCSLLLAGNDTSLPLLTVVVAFDSSLKRGAFVYTVLTEDEPLYLWTEGQHLKHNKNETNYLEHPKFLERIVHDRKWNATFTKRWDYPEHINNVELLASVIAIR